MFRGENLGRITLHIPGSHTVIDSMAAAAVSLYLGAEMHTVCSGLAAFRNTQRRFEFYGERDGIKIYHDYAHHPAEAAAALAGGADLDALVTRERAAKRAEKEAKAKEGARG